MRFIPYVMFASKINKCCIFLTAQHLKNIETLFILRFLAKEFLRSANTLSHEVLNLHAYLNILSDESARK